MCFLRFSFPHNNQIAKNATTTLMTLDMLGDLVNIFPRRVFMLKKVFDELALPQAIPVNMGIIPPELSSALMPFIREDPTARDVRVGTLFEQAFLATYPGGSENNHISFYDRLIRDPLKLLSDFLEVKLQFNRDGSDHSGAIVKRSRPDFLCWLKVDEDNKILVIHGEEKCEREKLQTAREELERRVVAQKRAPKGKIFGYVTAGPKMQMLVILEDGTTQDITPIFDLKDPLQRMRVVLATCKMYSCLRNLKK
jgi:hypothetical protein